MFKRNCIVCDFPFETNRFAQRTCSEQCAIEYRRQYQRLYARQHQYYRKNRKYINSKNREIYKHLRKKILKLIGSKCIICTSQKRINFHEIHGKPHPKPHPSSDWRKNFEYLSQNSKDFVPLCYFHHMIVHQFAKPFSEQWDKFKSLVETIN